MATVTPREKKPERLEAPPAKVKATAKSTKKRATARTPKPPGRKPWVPDYLKIEDWARQGLKDHEIAALSGICKQTFSEKKSELSELNEALGKGRAKGTSMASTALWRNMAGGDTQAIKFYLERVAGWKQTQVIEKGKDLSEFTDEELLALLDRDKHEGLKR
jgi:hypothetical protein